MLSKAFFAGVGQVPIDRSNADASRAALETGLRVLGEGKLLGIYPEGTRSPDGRLYRGKTGVAPGAPRDRRHPGAAVVRARRKRDRPAESDRAGWGGVSARVEAARRDADDCFAIASR